jgi:exodeoxyribonuclease VII large subunit
MQGRIAAGAARLESAARALQAISPLATLERGFAVVTRASDGALVTDARLLADGEAFDARLAHGSLRATVVQRRP